MSSHPGFVTIRPIGRSAVVQGPRSSVVIQAQHVNYSTPKSPVELEGSKEISFEYSIKVIPKKKSEFFIQKLRELSGEYKTVKELKEDVYNACDSKISLESFGYIEPGHGFKGKQRWLVSAGDLKDMYTVHHAKREVLLWASISDVQKKRAHSPDPESSEKRARYDRYLDNMTEVEMIEEELSEKHADGLYSKEQIRSWAHLIQMKKHSSYDTPPNKSFWKHKCAQRSLVSEGSSSSVSVSPSKKVNLRGQCVQQLLQLHQLLEKGGISKQQYEQMQSSIMGDVERFQ